MPEIISNVRKYLEVCFMLYCYELGSGCTFEIHNYKDWVSIRVQRGKWIQKIDKKISDLEKINDDAEGNSYIDDMAFREMNALIEKILNPPPF